MRLNILVCCRTANQYSEITSIFLRFQTEERVLRVNKSEIAGENNLMEIFFETEDDHEPSKNENTCF